MLRSSSSRGKAVFRFACGMLTSDLVAGVCHPYPIITSYSCFKVTSSFEEVLTLVVGSVSYILLVLWL